MHKRPGRTNPEDPPHGTEEGDRTQKKSSEEIEGTVDELLPNDQYSVKLRDGRRVRAMIAREVRAFLVKIVPGDIVTLKLFPYDPTRGAILKKDRPLVGGRGSTP